MLKFDSIKFENEVKNYNILEISNTDIAIIGIGIKLPMAETVDEFWENISCRTDCIGSINKQRKRDIENYLNFKNKKKKTLVLGEAAFLDEIDKFDYSFFKISPKEASLMDPSQRLFLETAWATIEDAGYTTEKISGSKTGIYLGYGADSEYREIVADVDRSNLPLAVTGNLRPVIAGRLSYVLDLHGPNLLVDSTCSSSLVAVHLACQAIRNGECELALAGGVQIHILPIRIANIGTESTDGRTKTFSDMSDGTGTGEGIGVVMLKPLTQALKDNDCIYAVIKGSAVNSDGNSIGLTAPNSIAQENVLVSAWKNSNIEPETISYIEAHGTGTKLGDPIEIEGIRRAFARYTSDKGICAVSSVKSNLGHLDSSAGIVGLIKAVMALKNKKIPPSINYTRPNRNISFINSPLYVNERLRDWNKIKGVRRCGVSSFGISGTNCHVVLEEAPLVHKNTEETVNMPYVFTLSANNKDSLVKLVKKYIIYLEYNKDEFLRDICYTSNTCRGHYNHRLAMIATDIEALLENLKRIYKSFLNGTDISDAYYGEHCVISNEREKCMDIEYTENEIAEFSSTCNMYLEKIIDGDYVPKELLENILELYIKGAAIDWSKFYKGESRRKVRLPSYAFERKRCWIEIPEYNDICNELINNMFYGTRWVECNDNEKTEIEFGNDEVFLIFTNGESQRGNEIAEELKCNGCKFYTVQLGKESYYEMDSNKICLSATVDNYSRLFERLDIQGVTQIIYLNDIQDNFTETISEEAEYNMEVLLSLFNFLKSLVNSKLLNSIKITLITNYAFEVTGIERSIIPINAALVGLFMSARLEYPSYKFKCIDIGESATIEEILREVYRENSLFKTSQRQGKSYFEEVYSLDINETKENKCIDIKDTGAYVITGGLGSMGLDFANYLSDQCNTNIVLIGRSNIPQKDQWEDILEKNEDKILCDKISKIKVLEEKGSKVHYYMSDVSCIESMQNVFEDIVERFEKINGIFHCAGIGARLEGCAIGQETENVFKQVTLPKIFGTIVLNQLVLKYGNVDFCVLFSSPITLIGGVGSSHYTAANCFLDAYASRVRDGRTNTITIDWAPWLKEELINNEHFNKDKQIFKPLVPAKGLQAFSMIMQTSYHRIIIGEMNFSGPVLQLGEYLPFKLSDDIKDSIKSETVNHFEGPEISNTKKYNQSIKLIGNKNNEYSNIEKSIANAWAEVLGYNEINIFDNFFELGGDSISIVKVHKLLEDAFKEKINIVDIFAYPTISSFTKYMSSKVGEEINSIDKIEDTCSNKNVEREIEDMLEAVKNGDMMIEQVEEYFVICRCSAK